MKIAIRNYCETLGVEGVVQLTCHWQEVYNGLHEEITTEDVICKKNGQHLRMTVVWTQIFLGVISIKPWVKSEKVITQEEYEKLMKEYSRDT